MQILQQIVEGLMANARSQRHFVQDGDDDDDDGDYYYYYY